ncbi:MAG: NAD-glutamate dehydrogenase, partial [Magnetococcales bacterium]|nr:NAD-glutamate dehydrogenase [Magnetococcales bacterium]
NPDPQASYQERHRLFQLPASTWLDYRQEVISAGGGVYSRTAKAISLSPEVRQRLAIQEGQLSGEALVRAVLKAPVDLLYNGGIGTYIKSSSESHAMVGDKANDAVRVDAAEVGAKVIAEGGNLGITRLGRLELARPRGGLPPVRLNSDAVDNSGGVDLSDHEVNLKILFHWLQQQGLLNEETRDHLMVALAPEVVKSVLADNHAQHLAISRDVPRSQSQGELYLELLDYLVEHAGLDPQVEAIPARDELQRLLQAGEGWPRPLLAILLGYAKIHVKGQVLASSLPDVPFSAPFLRDYFPPSLMDRFAEQVAGHFLRREIIAAAITNHMINHTGLGLLFGALLHHAQQGVSQWVQGWLLSDYLLDGATYRQEPVQGRLEEAVMALAGNLSHHPWLVLDESQLEPWRQTIRTMLPCLWEMLPQLVGPEKYAFLLEEQQQLVARGVKAEMASRLCLLPSLGMVPDLMAMASQGGPSLLHLVAIQWQLEDHFGLDWLEERLPKVRNRDKWGLLTVAHTRRQLQQCRWRLVERVALSYPDKEPALACLAFIQSLGQENEDYLTLLTQARRQEHLDLLPLTVLVAELREMV